MRHELTVVYSILGIVGMLHCMLHGMLEYVTMEGQIGEPRGYWLVLVPLPKFAAKAAASNTNDVAAAAFGPLAS